MPKIQKGIDKITQKGNLITYVKGSFDEPKLKVILNTDTNIAKCLIVSKIDEFSFSFNISELQNNFGNKFSYCRRCLDKSFNEALQVFRDRHKSSEDDFVINYETISDIYEVKTRFAFMLVKLYETYFTR